MTATVAPAGPAGVQTPAPPMTHLPCAANPQAHELLRTVVADDGNETWRYATDDEIEAALATCYGCPFIDWCATQPVVENTVMNGIVYDTQCQPYWTVAEYRKHHTQRRADATKTAARKGKATAQAAPEACLWCAKALPADAKHDKRYCNNTCSRAARRARARTRLDAELGEFTFDTATVERLCGGHKPARSTVADRREAVRRLHAAGLNDHEIAQVTGMCAQTALRARQHLGLPAVTGTRTSSSTESEVA